ncbi:hypothetical protein NM208_g3551 [Fusarium decemcellulare]|uniref:Uncharacterized protein n=1 Tax=Fusarium decemcellulare TaxID=57161 RepID=A0ACC1SNL8_9HYPO|nr:hypothetical protein NM208_g3551 [Fusarium decemcellulare]
MPLYSEIEGTGDKVYIRLLHLSPAESRDDLIHCQLNVVKLGEHPPYEALSYYWGDPKQVLEITCNHESFRVTENLFVALKHLRKKDVERVLWIDAICINQEDPKERSSQVLLMGKIYSAAEQVVIWLGPDPTSDGVDRMFDLIGRFPAFEKLQINRQWKTTFDTLTPGADIYDYQDEGSQDDSTTKPPTLSNDEVDALKATARRPWWTRIWTIQELALPPTAVVMCGHLTAPWSAFVTAFTMTLGRVFEQRNDDIDPDSSIPLPPTDLIISIVNARIFQNRPNAVKDNPFIRDLTNLLMIYRWSAATDPKDKVYGLLGMANSAYGIEPDYTISTTACYTRAAFAIICGSGSLDIFEGLKRPSCLSPTTLPDLPSWAPDWSYDFTSIPKEATYSSSVFRPLTREISQILNSPSPEKSFAPFHASGPSKCFQARLMRDGRTLVLRGFIIDTLEAIGENLEHPMPAPSKPSHNRVKSTLREKRRSQKIYESLGQLWSAVKGWEDLAYECENLQTGPNETREEALLATLCKDRIPLNADRAAVFGHMRTCINATFDYSKMDVVLKMLRLQHTTPRLYRTLVGYARDRRVVDDEDLWPFVMAVMSMRRAVDQRMARTKGGYLALVPEPSRVGDQIAILEGGKTPFVLRKVGQQWRILGDSYVHGIMFGEAWDEGKCSEMELI